MLIDIPIILCSLKRKLTYAEKVLYGHLDNPHEAELNRGSSYIKLRPEVSALESFR